MWNLSITFWSVITRKICQVIWTVCMHYKKINLPEMSSRKHFSFIYEQKNGDNNCNLFFPTVVSSHELISSDHAPPPSACAMETILRTFALFLMRFLEAITVPPFPGSWPRSAPACDLSFPAQIQWWRPHWGGTCTRRARKFPHWWGESGRERESLLQNGWHHIQ